MRFFHRKRASFEDTVTPRKKRRFWRILGRTVVVGCILAVVIVAGFFAYIAKDLPSAGNVDKRVLAESTKIYDRTGTHLLYDVHGEEKRTVINIKDIPQTLQKATISLEDQDFYTHHGIKFTSIARAILADVLHRGVAQGGSTITQQFVKNSLLTSEQSITRKIKEVILSLEMETKYSKDDILSMYLNEIPYGSNAYGIEAAAQTFFGKHAADLTLDESALLASLPKGPTYYSPYGSHTDLLLTRQRYALDQMASLGYITKDQATEAKTVDTLAKVKQQTDIIAAPHFVMYIKDYLEQKYGAQAVEQGGLTVTTTLDWDKQQMAETAIRDGATKNTHYKANNAALVSMDPQTGQILAMVGSKDYYDTSIDGQVNVTIADRQPGSSFKPYVYLAAFMAGYSPETILYDTPTNFETADGQTYAPLDYDGKFRGPLPMKETLPQSLNIPAVKTLYLVGVPKAIELAKNLGITGLNQPNRYGLSLVLGGGEVKLLDHVNAYGTLATGGIKHPKTAILKVTDAKGNVLEQFDSSPGERIVDEKYIAALDYSMSTNDFRAPIFGENNPLRFDNRPVAAKTGTTNEFRDAWTVGFTPSLVTGVWVGNTRNEAMTTGADGSVVAAPIWRTYMDKALMNYPIEKFPDYVPDDPLPDKPLLNGKVDEQNNLKVCKIPGSKNDYCLANKYCPDSTVEKNDYVSAHDILFYVSKDAPLGPIPDKPGNDSQFKNWEDGVKAWYKTQKKINTDDPPTNDCKEGDFKSYQPQVSLSLSQSGKTLSISANVNAPYGVDSVTFTVDGSDTSKNSGPYSMSYDVPDSKNGSTISVSVSVKDKNGYTASDSKSVSVSWTITPPTP